MNYAVVIEGQTIPVPEEIGAKDETVKKALTPYYPEIANAMITRVEKEGTVTITVVKKAGSKGQTPLDALAACPGGKNRAVALYEHIQQLPADIDPARLLALEELIEKATETGADECRAMEYAATRLATTAPRPSPFVPQGF